MAENKAGIQLKGMNTMFGASKAQEDGAERIITVPLEQLHPHPQNPYSVKDNEDMAELVELLQESGQQEAIIARPRLAGGYEIISGHRRHYALGVLGMEAKVVIREMNDNEAHIAMVDANAKRKNISPMELSSAYKLRIEAVARKRGRPVKELENAEKEAASGTARKIVAQEMGVSESSVQRYTSLSSLTPELQEMVDSGAIGVVQAADIAKLKTEEQTQVYEFFRANDIRRPGRGQVRQLKLLSEEGALTDNKIREVFRGKIEKQSDRKIVLNNGTLDKYFDPKMTPKEIENVIVGFLEKYKNQIKAVSEPQREQ